MASFIANTQRLRFLGIQRGVPANGDASKEVFKISFEVVESEELDKAGYVNPLEGKSEQVKTLMKKLAALSGFKLRNDGYLERE